MSTMQNTVLVVRHPKGVIPNKAPSEAGGEALAEVARFFEALAVGMAPGSQGESEVEIHRGSTDAAPARATATLVFSGASGTVGGSYNGVAITAAHGASDIADATAHAAAVNASSNALVQNFIRASNLFGSIQLGSTAAGEWVTIDGVRFTARVNPNSANASNGMTEFNQLVTGNTNAESLTARINGHPYLRDKVLAVQSTDTVLLYQLEGITGLHVFKEGANITLNGLSAGLLAAVATVLISSTHKSKLANAITIAASGTGVTASGARLTGGVGGDGVAKRFTS